MHRINALQLALSATQAALDRLDGGVLLLDSAGQVSFANRAALRMLASADGLRLAKVSDTRGRGTLHADNRLANHSLVAAIQSTLSRQSIDVDHFSHGVVIPRSSGKKSYLLELSALGNSHEFGPPQDAAVIAFLSDCERQRTVEPQVLRELYGLTKAEAKTAIALLDCGSARELAEFLGVSVHTVRTQIKNIYGKMSVDSRGRFVRLMMGLVSR
jgi:DNA-binding CsgD family transcriptional regulator